MLTRPLLANLVDYAGLFPPAALGMSEAVAAFAAERTGADAWMLGRFVVPAARLGELATAGARHLGEGDEPWKVSALVPNPASDMPWVRDFNRAQGGRMVVDCVEGKATTLAEIDTLAGAIGELEAYAEVPLEPDPSPLLDACGRLGLRAKARLGGVVPEAIPRPESVARFLVRCRERSLAFKATAGLHHAVRGAYPLTYEPGATRATMHGVLNLLFATHMAEGGADEADICAALEERDPAAFALERDGISWRRHSTSTAAMRALRTRLVAIGSCSFREPAHELTVMGLT